MNLETTCLIFGVSIVVAFTVLALHDVPDKVFQFFEKDEWEQSIEDASCEEIQQFLDYVTENNIRLYQDTEPLFAKYSECNRN